jgi:hypothetical protein
MKQITLNYQPLRHVAGKICPTRLLLTWGLYGVGMALLWRLAGENAGAQAATWLVALVAAAGLFFFMGEI